MMSSLCLRQKEYMDKIRGRWDFLIQCRPNVKGMIGNAKLIVGHINHNSSQEKIIDFIAPKGIFSYNEATGEFKSKS